MRDLLWGRIGLERGIVGFDGGVMEVLRDLIGV